MVAFMGKFSLDYQLVKIAETTDWFAAVVIGYSLISPD
jgi:hypothetical protein